MQYRTVQRIVDGHGNNICRISVIYCPEEYRTIDSEKEANHGVRWDIDGIEVNQKHAADYFSPLGGTGFRLRGNTFKGKKEWSNWQSIFRLVKEFSEQGVPFQL